MAGHHQRDPFRVEMRCVLSQPLRSQFRRHCRRCHLPFCGGGSGFGGGAASTQHTNRRGPRNIGCSATSVGPFRRLRRVSAPQHYIPTLPVLNAKVRHHNDCAGPES